jgi:hypothetical protein
LSLSFDPIGLAKRVVRPLFGDCVLGYIDYARFPDLGAKAGGPFNAQTARQALFREMVAGLQPLAIVETGAHLGTTTEFIAQIGLPVFTTELDARRWGYARARFRRKRNVTVLHGDSRAYLRQLFTGPLRGRTGGTLLFYLDAHWNEDLPLAEEIDIIFGRCPSAVVMADDFQVPGDDGYGYDDYGAGKSLIFAYVAPAISLYQLQAFYPSTPSTQEGGRRRGCIVLARDASHVRTLASMPLLRPAAGEPIEPNLNALPDAR